MNKITNFSGEYAWLSNFYPVRIEYNGRTYPSTEHAYMSAKSDDAGWKVFCMDPSNKPGTVKRKSREIILVTDWEDIKLRVMENVLVAKFNQEPFRSKLLATGDALLIEENWWGDKFWGVCQKTGKGENWLGRLLMGIRESIKNK